MSAHQLIIDHDKWRRGTGGSPAGVSGSDSDAYTGLDLNLTTFAECSFNGSSFSSTTFKNANWSLSQFAGASFNECELTGISISSSVSPPALLRVATCKAAASVCLARSVHARTERATCSGRIDGDGARPALPLLGRRQ